MTARGLFTQGQITKLAKGISKAGFESVRIEIKPTGEMIAFGSHSGDNEEANSKNEWDSDGDA